MDTYHYEGEVSWKTISKPHGRGTWTCYAQGGGSGAEDAFSWKYEGEFDQGHMTGQGTTTYGEQYKKPDLRGAVYSGAHEKGEAHGRGTWTCYAQGGGSGAEDAFSWKYEGEFDQGHMTGQGTTTYGDPYPDDPDVAGWFYIGVHLNGDAHGLGIWYYPDKTKAYDGGNQGGLYHGHGTSYRRDGTRQYEGTWKESCWKGNGTLYRPDGTILREREWVNGSSGEHKWQGEWQSDMCWYEGDWDEEEDPKPHGWGILYRPDRITVVREGWWQNGEPVDGPPSGYPEAA